MGDWKPWTQKHPSTLEHALSASKQMVAELSHKSPALRDLTEKTVAPSESREVVDYLIQTH